MVEVLLMKKLFIALLILSLFFSLVGCKTDTLQSDNFNHEITSKPIEKINTMNNDCTDIEVQRAIEHGIVPAEIQKDLDKQITFKQFCTMLGQVVGKMNKSSLNKWNEIAKSALASDGNMRRDDGMLALYYAADVIGVADKTNRDWGSLNDKIGEPWDEISSYHPQFPNWEQDIAPFENCGWNYMTSAYFYSMGRDSLFSNKLLFDYDEQKNSMRPSEPFTRIEAIHAALRLMETITRYVPLDAAPANTVSEQIIEKAKTMPLVSPQNLPKWRGYAYALWDYPTCYNWVYFSENTIKQLSDIGFNFLRMAYQLEDLFVEQDGHFVVNLTTFENLDDIISWCVKYDMHITIQLHQIPGMYTNTAEGEEQTWDILENPVHYQQAMDIYDFIAKRYANIPANVLSYTLLSEPPKSYFTFKTHAKLVQDLADVIRHHDPDKLILAAALMGDSPKHWVESVYFEPNYLLDSSIVQVESYYPWHNLRRSAFTSLLNGWPYDEAVVVSNVVWADRKPLALKGDFKKGTEITYYITGANGIDAGAYALCKADGREIGRFALKGFAEGKDNCSKILKEDGITRAEFGENGLYNGLEVTFTLPDNASSVELFAAGTDTVYLSLSDILIKNPSINENDYLVVDNCYQPTGINYQRGNFTSVIVHCSEIWENNASTVTINPDGTYTCKETYKNDVYDLNSMRRYYDKWEKWKKETGGNYFNFEFCSTFSMPEKTRVAYMRSVMEIFKEYGISWVFSGDSSQCGGIIVYKGAEDPNHMLSFPGGKMLCILPADGSYSVNSDYDFDWYYDDAVIAVMREFMK